LVRELFLILSLAVHNKGCAPASSGTIVQERVSAGWVPANPGIKKNEWDEYSEVAEQDVDLISARTDLINNVLTWELGPIPVNKYAVLTYQVKAPEAIAQEGWLKFNASWDGKSLEEEQAHSMQTYNYSSESHLEFDLEAIQQPAYPWPEPRSMQVNRNYNYSLKVTNIGDLATANEWNVSLLIPQACDVTAVYNSGTWNETTRKITWNLPNLAQYQSTYLNFTLNCSQQGDYVLVAEGIRDTRNLTTYVNSTAGILTCSDSSCSIIQSYTFTKPPSPRYEKLTSINFLISYNWTAYNLTIGQGFVNFTDDAGSYRLAWQNYSLEDTTSSLWANYSIDESEQEKFVSSTRSIAISGYSDGTYNPKTRVTVEQLAYTWLTGKLFNETQQLFIKAKVYQYVPLLSEAKLYINGNDSLTTGGWGEEFNFSVKVRDRFGRNVTVYLWHKSTVPGWTDWSLIDSWTCVACDSNWVQSPNFTFDYNESHIGTWWYKFNASNEDGNFELFDADLMKFVIEKDDVNVVNITPAWNQTVYRRQGFNFTLQAFDRDNKTIPYALEFGKALIALGKYGANETYQVYYPSPAINESGYISYFITNSEFCQPIYYLGQNYWYGGISGSAYYKDNLTRPSPFNALPYMLIGSLSNYYVGPLNTNFTRGDTILLRAYVQDDCSANVTALDEAYFNLTSYATGETYQCSAAYSGLAKEWQCSWDSSNKPYGWYNVTFYSAKALHTNGIVTQTKAFFLRSRILLDNPQKLPTGDQPWGKKPFNFTVEVTSEDGEVVNVYLWLKNETKDWWNENTWLDSYPSKTLLWYAKNLTWLNIGQWSFRFNASSVTGYVNDTLAPITFNITKEPIDLREFSGNNSIVNRSSGAINLTVKVWDLVLNRNVLNETEPGIPNVTLDEISFYVYNSTHWLVNASEEKANSTDYYREFNPGCEYQPESHEWRVNVSNSPYYQDNSTYPFVSLIVNVYADLIPRISQPINVNFTQGNLILLRGNVTDDCSNNVTGLTTIYFNLTSQLTGETYQCLAQEEGNGWYNCTFDTTGKPVGWYDVKFYASKAYYNPGIDTTSFYLSSAPQLIAYVVSPSSGGWGVPQYVYRVNVTDIDNDTVTVYFWLKNETTNLWTLEATQTCTNCLNTTLTFTKTYTKYNIDRWYYKFNATDEHNNFAESIVQYHNVTKDTVQINLLEGNNSYVNRSDSEPGSTVRLATYIYDQDLGDNTTEPTTSEVRTWITNDTINWREEFEQINSTGEYYYLDFNPDCNYTAGRQKWKMNLSSDYFFDSTSSEFLVNVIGSLINSIITPAGENYTKGQSILLNGSVTDDCGLATTDATVVFNLTNLNTGDEYQCFASHLVEGYYNCTFDTTGKSVGWYQVKMISNKTWHNDGIATVQFYLSSIPLLKAPSVQSRTGWSGWGASPYYYRVNVSDEDNDTVTVYFWLNSSQTNWEWVLIGQKSITNTAVEQQVTFEVNYQIANITTLYYKFNATDAHNNKAETSVNYHEVTKDTIAIEHASGNNAEVLRQGTNSVELSVRIYDFDNQSYTTSIPLSEVHLWITNDSTNWREEIESSNATHYYKQFDPDCNYLAGLQKWVYNVTNSQGWYDNTSSTFNLTIIGTLSAYLITPDGSVNYTKGQSILLRGNLTDDCFTNVTNAKVWFNISSDSESYRCPATGYANDEGNGYYNCTWDSSQATAGWYNVTMYAEKGYYINVSYIRQNAFYLKVIPMLKNASVTPESEGWSRTFNFTVNVTDPEDIVRVRLWRSVDKVTWIQVGSEQELINPSGTIAWWNESYTCSDVGNWYFKFNATDTEGNVYETTIAAGDYATDDIYTVEKDDVTFTYVAGNDTVATKTSSTRFILALNDSDASNKLISELARVDLELTLNNSDIWLTEAGEKLTNASGYFNYDFFASCKYDPGYQKWRAKVSSTDACYKSGYSSEFFVYLDMACPEFNVTQVLSPKEVFQFNKFGINATLRIKDRNATNTNITLHALDWLVEPSSNQYLGKITVGLGETKFVPVHWDVNLTTLSPYLDYYQLNITANTTDEIPPINYYEHANATNVTAYVLTQPDLAEPSLPLVLNSDEETVASWPCESGSYRIANLSLSMANLTVEPKIIALRLLSYNGSSWLDVLHSYRINLTDLTSVWFSLLNEQIASNESGYCRVKLINVGENSFNLTELKLVAYYKPEVRIQDIIIKVNETITTGLEPSESSFNLSVKIRNPRSESYYATLWVNITNSSGYLVNYTKLTFTLPASSTYVANISDINTSSWLEDVYKIKASLSWDNKNNERVESLIFKSINISVKASSYQCNSTTEPFVVIVKHPFADFVQYNVSFEVPSDWSYSPSYQLINASEAKDYEVVFNLTSSVGTELINASVSYSYPGIDKVKKVSKRIEASDAIAILEVARETPRIIASDKVFESNLIVHNKGCKATEGATIIKEYISPGWTPANPRLIGKGELIESSVDLENNIITWKVSTLGMNEYAYLTYQVKSPLTYPTEGWTWYNVSWDNGQRFVEEDQRYSIQTYNYSQESHVEFDLLVTQREEYPWEEARSIQPNYEYNLSLKVRNIGDLATGNEWNVSLAIPSECNITAVYNSGTWNSTSRLITWQLPNLASREFSLLNFTLNCSKVGKIILVPFAIRNTTNVTSYFDEVSYSCEGEDCLSIIEHVFTNPQKPYERLKKIDLLINSTYEGYNLTIGEGKVEIANDLGEYKQAYSHHSFNELTKQDWSNYTVDEVDEFNWRSNKHKLRLFAHADSTFNPRANLTLGKIAYSWKYGKLFNETQQLFLKSKVYVYTPLLTNATLWINNEKASVDSSAGWGEQFNFSVEVRDRFGRNVTVYAWHKPVAKAEWQPLGSWLCINCLAWTQANFSYNYAQNIHPDNITAWEFKFNATNADGNSELYGYRYIIEKDDINVNNITPAWNQTVYRREGFSFILEAFDRDNKTIPYALEFGKSLIALGKFGGNETYQIYYPSPAINESGYIVYEITNQEFCKPIYYLGQNYWYGGIQGSSYYKDNLTRPAPYQALPFMLIGSLSNYYIAPINVNFTRGDSILLKAYVQDDCGNNVTSLDQVYFNLTSYATNEVFTCSATLVGQEWQCSWDSSNKPYGWYNVTFYSAKALHTSGIVTQEKAFFLRSRILLNNPQVSPLSGSWEVKPFNFSVYVTSEDNESVATKLWLKNDTSWWIENQTTCSNCNNYYFLTQKNFTCENIGMWYAKFNATSATGYANETLAIQFNVTEVPLTINYAEGNNTLINRSDALPNNVRRLAVQIWDDTLNNYTSAISSANVHAYITTDGSNYVEETYDSKNETHYFIDFNPTCSYNVGLQKWKFNVTDACYEDETSSEFYITIIGDLNGIDLILPDGSQNFTAGQNISFYGRVVDDCSQPINDAQVSFKIQGVETYWCNDTISVGDGYYNCTWNSSGAAGGWYNVTMYASRSYYVARSDLQTNAFFLITPVELRNAQVSYPGDGGWGELYNFSIEVRHYASVNVCLLEAPGSATGPTQPYQITECKFVPSPTTWTLVNFTKRYSCADFTTSSFWWYIFNASEPGEPATYSQTTNASHILTKDDVQILHVAGNDSLVYRNKTAPEGIATFVVLVNDTDKGDVAYSPAQNSPIVRFYVHNGTAYILDGSSTTNSTGHSTYYFNPDCRYDAGERNWYAEVPSIDVCYKTSTSSYFNTMIVGQLTPVITYPIGQTYFRVLYLYVNVTGDVKDECNLHYFNNSLVNFTTIWAADESVRDYCSDVGNYGNGTYNCTFNATSYNEGWYHIEMNASNVTYYSDGTTKENYRFRVVYQWVPPVLQNETVLPEQDWGWGENFTFKVNVSDLNAEDVNVSLWLSPDNSTWYYVSSQICYDCGVLTELTFYYKGFSCSDMPQYYFKFNASDAHNTTDRPGINFTLTKDDVSIEYSGLSTGNNSWVNRSETVLLKVRIYDTDNKSYVPSNVQGKVWVTKDQVEYDSGWLNTTDSEGYLAAYFTPNCDYNVGLQYWKAGTYQDSCYKDANSTLTLVTNVKGWLNNTIAYPNGEAYLSNQNVTIRGNVTDECGANISDATVSFRVFHDSFSAVCEPVLVEPQPAWYNCTWNISNNPSGWYSVEMNSSRELYNNATSVRHQVFFHEVPPVLTGAFVTPTSSYWGSTFTFKVNVTDDDDIVNVTLWHRKQGSTDWTYVASQLCNDCINTTLTFTRTYTSAEIGTWEWFFNASDAYGNSTNTSIQTLTVTKRPVVIDYVAGNETSVSRVGNNVTILTLQAKDAVTGSALGAGLTGGFWVTTDGTNEGLKISVTTVSGGYLNLSFNPDCLYSVGMQRWKGGLDESSFYLAGNSTAYLILYIYSELYNNITSPAGESYWAGQLINISGNVRDDCSYVSGAAVRFRVLQGGTEFIPSPDPATDLANGTYRTSWDSTGAPLGWYNISMNSSKAYYNSSFIIKENSFYLGAKPELANPNVTPKQEGWGYNFTFNVSFRDLEGDANNITLWKAYSPSGPWYYVDSKIVSSSTWTEVKFYYTFDCSDYTSGPTIYFKFNATDTHGFKEESSIENLTLEKDDVSFYFVEGVGATVPREGDVYTRFTVRVNDSDRNAWVGEGVQGYFYFTLDGSTYDEGHLATTNASGYISYDFNPNCSYRAMLQLWYLRIQGNTCYKDTSSDTQTYSLFGQLKNNLLLPPEFSEFNVTDQILIRFNVSTDCVEDGLISDTSSQTITNIHNQTGNEYSCTPVNNEGTGWYNCTWDSTAKPEGNYSIRILTSRSFYYDNTTTYLNRFWLENRPPTATNLIVTPSSGGWGRTYRFNVTVTDPENDTVTCKLFVNTTGSWTYKGSTTIATPGNCSIVVSDFTCADQGTASFMFEIDDGTASNLFNTSVATGPTLQEDVVTVSYVFGNNSIVNRAGSVTTPLILRVYDVDKQVYPEGANGTIWVTNGDYWYAWNNQTNSTGYLTIYFDPDCSYSVGANTWFGGVANDVCYVDVNTTENYTVNIKGDLIASITQPNGEEYLRGSNVTIRGNLTDECLAPITEATVNFTSKSLQTLQEFVCSPVIEEGSGWYNCTFNTSSPVIMPTQWYNVTMKANKTNYNDVISTKYQAFWIETKPELFAPQVIPRRWRLGRNFHA
jgi:hypothetical protein